MMFDDKNNKNPAVQPPATSRSVESGRTFIPLARDPIGLAAQYDELLRNIPDGIYIFKFISERSMGFTYVSPRLCEILGLDADAVLNDYRVAFNSVHPDDAASLNQANLAARTSQHQFRWEGRFLLRGEIRWLRITSSPKFLPVEGGVWHGVVSDITDHRQVEQQLLVSEQKWKLLFENMPTGFALHEVLCDDNGHVVDYRFLETNAAYENLTGLVARNIIGKTVLDVLPGTEKYWIDIFGKVALTGTPTSYENFSKELGKWYQVKIYSPKLGQFAVMISDITEIKMIEEKLTRMNAELEERVLNRTRELAEINLSLKKANDDLQRTQNELIQHEKMTALGVLVAGVSHEMNTPLGNGLTASSSMQEEILRFGVDVEHGKITKTRLKEFNQFMHNGLDLVTRNLNRAIEQVRHFKQVSVDQASEQRRSFELKSVIDDNVSILKPQFKHTRHQIVADIPAGIRLDSYPGAISQVLTNLVLNSLIHGFSDDKDGVVTISAQVVEDNHLKLMITDNGKGIPPKNIDRVFDPFFTTRMGQGGSGLGLNIVFNIVKSTLGGTILVDSAEGEYCIFSCTFPLIAPA